MRAGVFLFWWRKEDGLNGYDTVDVKSHATYVPEEIKKNDKSVRKRTDHGISLGATHDQQGQYINILPVLFLQLGWCS